VFPYNTYFYVNIWSYSAVILLARAQSSSRSNTTPLPYRSTKVCQGYTGWSKNHATHSSHVFQLSRNKLHWNMKKNNVMSSVGNVHRVQRCIH
jgi:hypothetical protein